MDKENPTANRGFGFLTFYNYPAAEQALRRLSAADFTLGGRFITVTWAEPKKTDEEDKVRGCAAVWWG